MMQSDTHNLLRRPITNALRVLVSFVVVTMGSHAHASHQPEMDAGKALEIYQQVDGWVRAWDMPVADAPEAMSEPVSVAVVTLRLDGRVFGRGSAASPDADAMVVWQAASAALNAANSKLTQERDAMWEAFIRDLADRIMISVELGTELVPVSPNELELPGFGYSPGSVGLAVRIGDRADAIGPTALVVRRGDPARSAAAMCLKLSEDPDLVMQTPTTLAELGYTFYRWSPMSVAQPAPGLGGVFLDRAGRVIENSEISMSGIKAMGDKLAAHLISRQWDGVENYGFMGTLDPVTGKSASAFAGPFEQAMGAYALLRYGSDAANKAQREAVEAAREVLRELGRVENQEVTPWDDPIAACMAVIALSEVPLELTLGDKDLGMLRTKCLETLDTLYDELMGFDPILPAASHGLVAHAFVVSKHIDPRDRTELAGNAIARVYLDTPTELLVGQMPFLGWAQLEHAQDSETLASAAALRQMREIVWEHQLSRSDLDWMDRDLAGGIVFTRSSAPLPSWSCLRPLSIIATMLGDERVTPGSAGSGEVPAEIGKLVSSIRFVRQLAAEGETLHMFADAEDANWGIRMALWDQRMPIESSAMALLMITETQRSFGRIMER